MGKYRIIREYKDQPDPISFTVNMKEMNALIGEFVGIYNLIGRIEIRDSTARAYEKTGEFISSITWGLA